MSGPLLHSPADILSRLLIAKGHGVDPPGLDWPIYTSQEPNSPDSVITVYGTQGRMFGRYMHDGTQEEQYGIQIRLRATDDVAGSAKAWAVARALDSEIKRDGVTISGTSYCVHMAKRTSNVIPLGTEFSSKRLIYTINALVALNQTV